MLRDPASCCLFWLMALPALLQPARPCAPSRGGTQRRENVRHRPALRAGLDLDPDGQLPMTRLAARLGMRADLMRARHGCSRPPPGWSCWLSARYCSCVSPKRSCLVRAPSDTRCLLRTTHLRRWRGRPAGQPRPGGGVRARPHTQPLRLDSMGSPRPCASGLRRGHDEVAAVAPTAVRLTMKRRRRRTAPRPLEMAYLRQAPAAPDLRVPPESLACHRTVRTK